MRILIVSKFFYPRGGACMVAIGTRDLLIKAGHNVRVFAMTYPENLDIPDARHYASQIDFKSGLIGKIKAFKRLVGKGDVAGSFRRVLNDFNPDIVHLHNIHSYLSPIVGELAHEYGAKVVWTLHDFKLLCPAYTFRKGDGGICHCISMNDCQIIRYRCLKNSYLQSAMAYIEALEWSRQRINMNTDIFISPSRFMRDKMVCGGFDPGKIQILHNFIDPEKQKLLKQEEPVQDHDSPFFAYTGRLSEEKGLETLTTAAISAGVTVKIAGDGPLRARLEKMSAEHEGIKLTGRLNACDVARMQREAIACLCPSEWFENNPLAVIESLCAGTPVIGADIGGIPELIEPGINGLLYPTSDTKSLSDILKNFRTEDFDRTRIAEEASHRFSSEQYISGLLDIYKSNA